MRSCLVIFIHNTFFFKSKIVKLPGKIKIENCLFISKYVNNKLPPIFNSWFIFSSTCHNYETSFAAKGHLKIPTVTTTTYGKGAFISMTTKTWNNTKLQTNTQTSPFPRCNIPCFGLAIWKLPL